MSKAFPIIAGTADIPSQENLYFGNLKHLTDGSITKAKLDFYNGARPAELNTQVREQLSEYIEPTEAKGPDGSAPVCELQAMYDGALGARGIHELRSYVDPETAYDNNAYTITSTYHDTFRQGASALRNARDWAKEKREELMIAANGKVPDAEYSDLVSSTQSFVSLSSNEATHPESEMSADELALDVGTFTSSSHRTPVRAQTNLPPKVSSNQQSNKASQVSKRPGRRPEASQVIYREPRL
ncbi:hypothetical protein OEA41_008895 [Lepraria neglecta]|uniref:Uncharacterized protein n=1 Tax=Lepraria neglecta TaxID=209136 RepID=A0AAE0DH69_9LECA|nr:hypothetical protein OEA41_008895 [Lepraria neglecta]